ncbi:unnamed protein product [Cladocopium goreaui]|uniref:Uncharacterized protein n=1 Tax=Cladocopium goreaui TaxID=2562237 RepID=A0A9P1DBR2_9DINO|nr:unnamed protein product [Cladocopium goreaui]
MEIGTKGSGLQGPDEELPLRLLRGRGGHKERPDEGHIATGHQDARCGRLLLCPLRRILRQVETSCALADAKDTQIGQSLRPVQHAMALPATNRNHGLHPPRKLLLPVVAGAWALWHGELSDLRRVYTCRCKVARIRVFAVTFTQQCLVTGDGLYRRGRLFGALTASTTVGSWLSWL